MKTIDPGPDVILGECGDCQAKTRLFELRPGHQVCLGCLRDLVVEITDEADTDAVT